ncbi:MAG: radical SAM protein [Proteobacteria bacterium]|nr:radical SAM protein [Pseudomonadota bacterium]
MAKGHVIREEDFGGLIFNKMTGSISRVNPTGAFIAHILSNDELPYSIIIGHVRRVFGLLTDDQELAISTYLEQLEDSGIVESGVCDPEHLSCKSVESDPTNQVFAEESSTSSFLRAPLSVWWDITGICNLKCKQCYSSSGKALADELSTTEVFKIIDDLASMRVFYIHFLGGEPFARKDFLKILEHCQLLGIVVMISSNGWFFNDKLVHEVVRLGVRHVRVSIDGSCEATHDEIRGVSGSFNRAVTAVKLLKRAGLPLVGIGPTIMKENFAETEALIDLAASLGADEIQLDQICKVGRGTSVEELDTEEHLSLTSLINDKTDQYGESLLISAPEGTWERKPFLGCVKSGTVFPDIMGCGAGRTCLAIAANGKVRACLFYRDYEVGDLKQTRFQDIWKGKGNPRVDWLRKVKDGCLGCIYETNCSGPCPMQAINSSTDRAQFVNNYDGEKRCLMSL